MITKKISDIQLDVTVGDITEQKDIEAIVNAANAYLTHGGGVSGAIHRKAGPELEKESMTKAPIKPGEAVITKGYNLPNKYVIHCLGPVYGSDKNPEQLLSNCYKNALKLAEENRITSIAFPAISTGIFGYPIEEAAKIAIKTVLDELKNLKFVKLIRFVLYDNRAFEIYKETLDLCIK
jgi:O-acetyl-ADP-ribose deacetylase (regulator of RNase III)